ncbi:hypothetical protein METBIDRAFT_42575 [Metschnikowia bicuspidata var. bicuspidata NRRL YB-4993]|uniref:Spindle pole body component n=1 Tax=Metschnikowia bicuspidata var. bicuspidata NRRL YB-4993 TaxID=869754 RepID=A0A1A0HCK9_9ASCO|nr:hypothetical protein METBIDRAFT_42575 [Metschnikowia bicuspidata var. bicuspidata NRRL YB-4993]OBA21730.1 hypothetical protein METBIDRAFT_42575 [Metschnikowia bicuspidata var. bicuspidata NRRL YB-4993]
MASGDPDIVRLYLNRLVGSLAPSDRESPHVHTLVNDLTTHITRPFSAVSAKPLPQILDQYHRLFLQQNRADDWREFQGIVDAFMHPSLPDSFTRNLIHLSRLCPSESSPDSDKFPHMAFKPVPPGRVLSPFSSSPHQRVLPSNSTMPELIDPYYKTLDEQALLASLRHTLAGQDTNLLRFLRDFGSIEIPDLVNTSYTQLLTDILEPALLGKSLHVFLDSCRGSINSPITTAFLTYLQRYLVFYADTIEGIFRTAPKTLLALLDSLEDQTHNLRFLGHLKSRLAELDGFEFLLEVYRFSQFGDIRIEQLARNLFDDVSTPYYQYLQHWIVRGELIDESDEFFVSFDKKENHINDIIKYDPKKLPVFLKVDDEIFTKMFQIGKTLVFLEKYCKELDWVNEFALRYFQFISATQGGLMSMSANKLQVMIDRQYEEVLEYFTQVVHSKYLFYSHLLVIKRVMLMESSDFVNAVTAKGAQMFSELASSLTSARLSELLIDSIDLSSIKCLSPKYQKRIDARILDLSHGTIGWDVFTLAYSAPEPPLEALLNYQDQNTQYLRLFNFLWGLKHYQFLLREHFLLFQEFHKQHLRHIKMKLKASQGATSEWSDRRLKWLTRSLRIICLIRHRFAMLIDAILNFVSFDLVENSFNEHVVRKLFQTCTSKAHVLKKDQSLLLTGLQTSTFAHQNTNSLTIDDLTATHIAYLKSVSDCKLLREDACGRHSGKSFVHQIFELLELTYAFLRSSEEFGTALSNYVSILRLKSESFNFDEDWDDLHHRLNSVETYIQKDVYVDKFQPWLKAFTHDMRAEVDLKEFSKMM